MKLLRFALISLAIPAFTHAQSSQWLTFGHDPQRSGWTPEEHAFTPANVAHMQLLWKTALPNRPHSLNGLTAPLVVAGVPTVFGTRNMVIVGGSSDHLFAVDADSGAPLWQLDFNLVGKPHDPDMWLCPNALNDTPVIDAQHRRVFVISADGRLRTVNLADGTESQPPLRFVAPYSKMWSLNYSAGVLYTSLSQDCNAAPSGIFAINPDAPGHPVSVFWSSEPPPEGGDVGFGGGGIWGRGGPSIDFDGFVYGASGDAPFAPASNQFGDTVLKLAPRTLDLADFYTPADWEYITRADLDMGTTTPLIFRWNGRVLTATGGKGGLVYVTDTRSMGGADHHHAAYISPRLSNDEQTFQTNGIWGVMSTWPDETAPRAGEEVRASAAAKPGTAAGDTGVPRTRRVLGDPAVREEPSQGRAAAPHGANVWLYVPVWGVKSKLAPTFPLSYGAAPHGSIMAFHVLATANGSPALQPAWMSTDIAVPEPVAIAGGVVFALGTGENTEQVYNGDINRIIPNREAERAATAVLHALDARTGKELWNSGRTMTDWTHFSGLAVAQHKVFVVTHDGTLYAFGLPR